MAFPANLIGIAAGAAGGAYVGYHQCQAGPWTGVDYALIFLLAVVAIFFGLILS